METSTATLEAISPNCAPVEPASEPNPSADFVKRLSLQNSLDAVIARATVRKLAASFGYSLIDQVRIATAIFEIADRIVSYAGKGEIVITWRKDDPWHQGLSFFCNDLGIGAPELTSMLQTGGDETSDKLNFLGLKRLADEFEVAANPHYGNCVTAVIWKE